MEPNYEMGAPHMHYYTPPFNDAIPYTHSQLVDVMSMHINFISNFSIHYLRLFSQFINSLAKPQYHNDIAYKNRQIFYATWKMRYSYDFDLCILYSMRTRQIVINSEERTLRISGLVSTHYKFADTNMSFS